MTAEILTIGHSTHPAERFRELLAAHRVAAIADVRRFPASRRLPHFNAGALSDALAAAGIEYVELGEALGGRRRRDPRSPNDGWRVPGFRAYADHMDGPQFAAGLRRLEELGRSRRTAFMCAEGDWRRCHRRLIADALLVRRWRVVHIRRDGRTEPHALTEFATVDGERLVYPGPQGELELDA